MAEETQFWSDGLPAGMGDGDGTTTTWFEGVPFPDAEEAITAPALTGGTGIVSGEAFGSGGEVGVQSLGGLTGIPSGEAFGSGGFVHLHIVGASGIASGEAFGSGGAVANIAGTVGIPSEEAFGSGGVITRNINGVSGIPSAEAFGDGSSVPAGVSLVLSSGVNGIASGEAFGSGGSLYFSLGGVSGIPSAEAFGASGVVVNLDTSLSPFGIYIDGENRTNYLRVDGVSVDEQLNFNSAATIRMVDEANVFVPSVGETVVILHLPEGYTEWQRIFAGSVESVQRMKMPGADRDETFYELRCVDFARALSRRRISKKYAQADYGTLTSILTHISENFLIPEGITWVYRGDPGITIPDIEFSGVPLNEALGTLAELTGWDWAIDYYQNFYMYDRPAYTQTAPIDITEEETGPNSNSWFDLTITTDRGLYRNRQLVKSSQVASTTVRTKSYTSTVNYVNPYAVFWNGYLMVDGEFDGRVQSITDVRINGTSVPFYSVPDAPVSGWVMRAYDPGALTLQYNSPVFAALPEGTVLDVDFILNNDLPEPASAVENSAEITARQAIESGTGIYEDVFDAGDITDPDTLLELAQQLLARFSEMGREIEVSTDVFGFEPGQEIGVELVSRGITATTYTVEAVTKEEKSKTLLRYKLKISNRIQQRDALTAMDRLVKRMRKTAKQAALPIQFELAKTLPGITNPGLIVAASLGNAYIVRAPITLRDIALYFKTPSTGADIIIDIKRNGTSIFPVGFVCSYPLGNTGVVTYSQFANAPLTLAKDDILTLDVLQVGSIVPGKDGTATLYGWA